ncbi:growth arrest-specific protein 6-like isoform X1 [Genypterus blacodes]|uniref:growth arrest-specific protein 6-like isoform X1 n=1 Tax=Genypterus blacodes TaxID=154954 RepID=UPI003F76F874
MWRKKGPLGETLACLVFLVTLNDAYHFLSQSKASQFLSRHRRANSLFEESKKGNLERECIEELCNKEEAREIFENQPETDYFYPRYVVCLGSHRVGINNQDADCDIPSDLRTCVKEISDQCSPYPCYKEGTKSCVDGQATFTCVCKPGWNGPHCEDDIDECSDPEFPAGCNQKCHNIPGSFRCMCDEGYFILDKINCIDIDECRRYPSICEEPATCVNTPGMYECQCPAGFKYNFTSRTCNDVDECEDPGVCGTAHCVNKKGSYDCFCDTGYVYDNETKSCIDVDECEEHVCAEECVNTPGSFRCFCDGRQGMKLGQDLRSCKPITPCMSLSLKRNSRSLYLGRMFSGVPVVRLRFRRRIQTGFSAEFDFRTYDPEGVIFFAGGHLNSSWIVLAMHHGRLELQLKYGTVSRVTSSGPIVNDGQWRKISVEEQGRSLVIKIDRDAVMKIAVNGDLFTLKKGMHELNLTVGGVPFKEDSLVNQVNPRLDGCMREWHWLTGEDTSIQETIRSNDNMQCFSSEDPGAYFPGTGFALFNISYEPQNLSVHLTLRPTSAIGVLFALVHQDSVPLSIVLADYHPGTKEWRDFILVSAGDVLLASVPAPLCDCESHVIQVTISGNQTVLLVDGQAGRSEDSQEPVDLLSPSSTFIGGLPDVPLVSTLVSAPYSGCMEVSVNGQPLDLDHAVHKHNDIRSHSCPLLDSHQ